MRKDDEGHMICLKDEKGMALVMSLILATVSLAFASTLLYMGIHGSKMSGLEKRYRTAMAAAKGGVGVSTKVIDGNGDDPTGLAGLNNPLCVTDKLNTATVDWPGLTSCLVDLDQIKPDPMRSEDMWITLGSKPNQYKVSMKVVDTVVGNSAPVSAGTFGGGESGIVTRGVDEGGAGSGVIRPMHMPYIYTVEVNSVNTTNVSEVAQITYVYVH